MIIKTMKKTLLFLITSLLLLGANAESFRVHKCVAIALNPKGESATYEAGINDGLAITLPEDIAFIQGIEITFKIPESIADYRNSVIYTLYKNISPFPTSERIDYTGVEIANGIFPPQLSWVVQVPISKANTFKETPYSDKIRAIPDFERGFVFLRTQLAMKGVPSSVINAKFAISVKPIYIDKGRLKLSISTPTQNEDKNYTVLIDEKPVTLDAKNRIMLKPGMHNVSIISDSYRNEHRTVMIERAEESALAIALSGTEPIITLTMPENTTVLSDGVELDTSSKSIYLAPGEHEIKFIVGGYEVTKQVVIQEGRTYNISLSIDAVITEEN